MANTETCLAFQNVSMEFPGVKALDDVSFTINKGEIHALMGANGAGKSTLIKILARVYQHTDGDVILNEENINRATPENIRNYGIDFIFQELELVSGFTVAQNVMIGIEPRTPLGTIDWRKMTEEAQKALDDFMPGVVDAGLPVSKLSVAKQQIVSIVRALHRKPKIVVFDEPTSRLSATETEALFAAIKKLKEKQDLTIIYVSHRLEELFRICDRVTILRDGRYTGTWNLSEMTEEDVVYHMVGKVQQNSAHSPIDPEIEKLPPAFEVEHLRLSGVIEDISFSVRPGEIVALAGAVGAKKTETFEAVMGIRQGAEGTVRKNGEILKLKGAADAKRRGICLVPEDRRRDGVIVDFTVRENTTYAFLKNFTGRFGLIRQRAEMETVQKLNKKLQVKTPGTEACVKNLSGGNIQKVVVAKWLTGDSDVYFFDEPTVGIDVRGKSEIYDIIRDLAAQGKAVVVASSEIEEAINISDNIYVLYNGRVVANRVSCLAKHEEIVYLTMGGAGREE